MKPLIESPLMFLAICLLVIAALAIVAGLAEYMTERDDREIIPKPNVRSQRSGVEYH